MAGFFIALALRFKIYVFRKHEIQKDISRRGRRERREVKIFIFCTAALILLGSLRSLRTLQEKGVSVERKTFFYPLALASR